MHGLVIAFRVLVLLVAAYAFWRGSRDEKVVALICIAGTVLSHLVAAPQAERYMGVEMWVLLVDAIMLTAFVAIALRSPRFWPLWVAGLQLTTILGHAMKAMSDDLVSKAYGMALGFWAYPIVIIVAIGTWRTHRRMVRTPRPMAT